MKNKTIQFNINSDDTDTPGISALKKASKIANKYNISDMSQDEINVEIAESRKSLDWYYFVICRRKTLQLIFVFKNKSENPIREISTLYYYRRFLFTDFFS